VLQILNFAGSGYQQKNLMEASNRPSRNQVRVSSVNGGTSSSQSGDREHCITRVLLNNTP